MQTDSARRPNDPMDPNRLQDVLPYTKRGELGLVRILAAKNVQAWVEDHAAELLEEGYVRVVVREHLNTGCVGDWRRDADRYRMETR